MSINRSAADDRNSHDASGVAESTCEERCTSVKKDDVSQPAVIEDDGFADINNPEFISKKTPMDTTGGPWASITNWFHTTVPPGGHVSNIFNLASNTLGAGIVSMPSTFNNTGILLSIILMCISAVLMCASYYLLGMVCERSRARSWEEAARILLFRGSDYMVAGILLFFMAGVMTAYVIATHDLIGPFLQGQNTNPFLQSVHGHRLLTAIVWMFGMLSLSLPRRVASLRYFSIMGVSFIMLFVFAIVFKSVSHGLPHARDMKLFTAGLDAVNGATLFIFAFSAHGLACKLYSEMPQPSARNLAIAGGGSISIVGVLYVIVGFFGYADIGLRLSGSIFGYYSVLDDVFMMIVYLGVLIKICIAYALCAQSCRLPIYYLMRKSVDTMPLLKHVMMSMAMCLVTLMFGLFIPNINIVFNLLGSICGGSIALLLPAFMIMYTGGWTVQKVGWLNVLVSYILIVSGVVAIVFGTAMTIRQIYN